MEPTLSASELALIEHICGRYLEWDPGAGSPPRMERVLGGGLSNRSVLLRGSKLFVLRLGADAALGVCRDRELRMHQQAAANGLAPGVRFADVHRGLLITDYLNHEDRDVAPPAIAGLLRAIHDLPASEDAYTLAGRLVAWDGQRADDSAVSRMLRRENAAYEALQSRATILDRLPAVVCHNDLLRANRRLHADQLMAIDWEYAAMGSPYFDLAVCASELTAEEADQMLEHYLARKAGEEERRHMHSAQAIYAVIGASWYERYSPQTAAAERALHAMQRALINLPA